MTETFVYRGHLGDELYPNHYKVDGLDVSKWQGDFDFELAISEPNNVSFVFCRCSYSFHTPDSEYARNISECMRLNIPSLPYHFLVPTHKINDSVREAELALQMINDHGKGTMRDKETGKPIIILDLETRGDTPAKSQELFDYIWKFIDHVEKAGFVVIIYSSKGFLDGNLRPKDVQWLVKDRLYWQAQYTHAAHPKLPNSVTEWTFWQWSGDENRLGRKYGSGGSHAIDIDRFNGSWEEFSELFLGGEHIPPEPEPEPPVEEECKCLVAVVKDRVTDGLTVRKYPTTRGSPVGELPAGSKVRIKDVGGASSWVQIADGEYIGYWIAVEHGGRTYCNVHEE